MTQEKKTKYIDHLTEDQPLSGQSWVCMSFLSPEGLKNCNIRGLKIRGVYADREDADKRAKELQEIDPDFHVFVGEIGKWLPWDPDPSQAKDEVYQEKELNDLMKEYKNNLSKAKTVQEQRKVEMLKKAAAEENTKSTNNSSSGRADKARDRLKHKIDVKNRQKKFEEIVNNANKQKAAYKTETEKELEKVGVEIKESEKMAVDEKERLDTIKKTIDEKEAAVTDIDSQLAKIQELYKKINKK